MDSDAAPGYIDDKASLERRLARIEGQVRGLRRMVDEEAYCVDVLTQISAVERALDGVALKLLSDHTDHCVRAAVTAAGQRPVAPPRTGLPPGPRMPAPFQTFGVVARPVPFFESCRRRFGQTFTLRILRAGEMVFISDPPSLKRLFAADRRNTIAPGRNVVLRPVLGARSVLLLEGDDHLQRRKLMLPPFHGERMRAYETVMANAAERAVAGWPVGRPFRLHASMQAITFEVILAAVFGVEDDARRAALSERLTEVLATTRSPLALGMTLERARSWPRFRRIARMLDESDQIMFAEIADRRADAELGSREDILSMLVAARFDDGSEMTNAELRDQLMTLLLAGHETTATALA